eukprot:713508-Hanusia_phi.AAC.1
MLLTGDGRTVKIGDFGISRLCPSHGGIHGKCVGETSNSFSGFVDDCEMTARAGTFRYMAPEIFRGEARYTAAVD